MNHRIRYYTVKTDKPLFNQARGRISIALVSDLHDRSVDDVIRILEEERPDIIAAPGDITNNRTASEYSVLGEFLRRCACIAPTYYSYGNHEGAFTAEDDAAIAGTGAVLLDNSFVRDRDIVIGGFSSGYLTNYRSGSTEHADRPDPGWLGKFCAESGFRILLCHHPEYYKRFEALKSCDLILSGHAHGGQIRIFGHGLYAPGQGMFPKYTSGLYDAKLVVGTGLANTGGIVPRLFNPTEVVIVRVGNDLI